MDQKSPEVEMTVPESPERRPVIVETAWQRRRREQFELISFALITGQQLRRSARRHASSVEDAEDAIVAALEMLWMNREWFEHLEWEHLKARALTKVKRETIRLSEQNQRANRPRRRSDAFPMAVVMPSGEGPVAGYLDVPVDDEWDHSEGGEALIAAVMALPRRQREVVLLRYEGLTLRQTGEALGISESSATTYLRRARVTLSPFQP